MKLLSRPERHSSISNVHQPFLKPDRASSEISQAAMKIASRDGIKANCQSTTFAHAQALAVAVSRLRPDGSMSNIFQQPNNTDIHKQIDNKRRHFSSTQKPRNF